MSLRTKRIMDKQSQTEKARGLGKTIIDDLKRLLSENFAPEHSESGIANALKGNIDKIVCFENLHDYVDANTLGETEQVWDALTEGIGPEGDEGKIQDACDVLNEARGI